MLMEVKSQLYATYLSIKYALQRELLNKVTFISNIIFMIINNGSFIIQWIILYSLRDDVGGYSFKQVLLLWGITSFTFGISRFFFKEAFQLTETINNGKLDNYLVQPKNVLISCITAGEGAEMVASFRAEPILHHITVMKEGAGVYTYYDSYIWFKYKEYIIILNMWTMWSVNHCKYFNNFLITFILVWKNRNDCRHY